MKGTVPSKAVEGVVGNDRLMDVHHLHAITSVLPGLYAKPIIPNLDQIGTNIGIRSRIPLLACMDTCIAAGDEIIAFDERIFNLPFKGNGMVESAGKRIIGNINAIGIMDAEPIIHIVGIASAPTNLERAFDIVMQRITDELNVELLVLIRLIHQHTGSQHIIEL